MSTKELDIIDEELTHLDAAEWDQLTHDWSTHVAKQLNTDTEAVWAKINTYDTTEYEACARFASEHNVDGLRDYYECWRLQNPSSVPDLKNICNIVNKIKYIIKPANKEKVKLIPIKKKK